MNAQIYPSGHKVSLLGETKSPNMMILCILDAFEADGHPISSMAGVYNPSP